MNDHNQPQPDFGRRLLSTLIDERAHRNHPTPFASIPRSADPKDGYQEISYRLFANAVDRCAWWIKRHLSLSDRFEPLMYVGAFDLRYQILTMAAVKTGYVMFFISPRNSIEAQLALVDDAKVTKLLFSQGSAIESVITPILQQRPLQKLQVPEVEELLLTNDEVHPFDFHASFDEHRMKPLMLLHTSGSTGLPKIVTLRHGYVSSFDACWLYPTDSDLLVSFSHKRMFVPYPPFHVAGVIVSLGCSVYIDATAILPPAVPLTAEIVNDVCVNARVEVANIPPSILMEMVQNPTYLNSLQNLDTLAYGGGPLPQETGDELNKSVRITSFFGSTELCIVPTLVRPQQHWKYFKFDDESTGMEFRRVPNTTDLFELVFVRDPDLSLRQAIFVTFPDTDEFHTKDLFSKHPTAPDLWRYEGRLDDIIVLNNAEKINPVTMEGTISSCPVVKGALVVGSGRFQTALLIEVNDPPHPDQDEEREELLNSIWPYVDMANKNCPKYGRIARELVAFNRADKSFVRAGKGTIQRAPSLEWLSKEIDDLYARADRIQSQSEQQVLKSFEDTNETQDFLRHWILRQTRLGQISTEQDFFNSGMDSLDVVNLVRQIRSIGRNISTKQVYDNPNIKRLASSLKETDQSKANDKETDLTDLQQMFQELKFDATENPERTHSISDRTIASSRHVVLIGSTGSLGPYLLDEMLGNPTITRITCLNRSADARSRQTLKHTALALSTDFHKVTFLKTDLCRPDLGLEKSDYEGMLHSASHIIYNAWAVNFNQHIGSFKPLLEGVKNTIAFTYACIPRRVRLFFMSSVSVADRVRAERPGHQVHETPLNDWTLARLGYGQSKLVAEGLITDAVERYGIDAAICRLCQIGGPVNKQGEWTRAEWIPSMILSSKAMGIIPASLGAIDMVDWVPIDLVATICLELLFHDGSDSVENAQGGTSNGGTASSQPPVRIWHVVNPNPTLWSLLSPSITAHMSNVIEPTDLVHWIDKLKQGSDSNLTEGAWDPECVPSVKLISLFEELKKQALKHPQALPTPVFDTKRTVACSKTLAQVSAVSPAWIELWMKQWNF